MNHNSWKTDISTSGNPKAEPLFFSLAEWSLSRYSSGVLSAMSAMVNIEIPWINILSKMDLVTAPKKNAGQEDFDDDEEKRDGPGPLNGRRGRRNVAK